MASFDTLGVRADIVAAIKKLGFYEPTDIQTASIPLMLAGKDVIANSNTGSGKTFAFGAGIIQRIHPQGGVQAIILVPTRELAEQMFHAFQSFSKGMRITTAAVYGGVSLTPQFKAIKQAEIIIGTPGRTLDHLERGSLRLDRVKHAILDEADRMLDMGFLPDVKKILKQCPQEKQLLLFSATMPTEVKKLAQQFMVNPEHINLAEHVDPRKLSQETYLVDNKAKQTVLATLLKQEGEKELVIIFCNTRSEVDRTTKLLRKEGIKATAIHGGLSQNQRLKVIKMFNSKSNSNVLVCTDVAARGLDIPGITHVYNYDLPREPKQYIHRIGRTARAGANGKAVNLVSQRDLGYYRQILRSNSLTIPHRDVPLAEQGFDPAGVSEERSNPRGTRPTGRRGSSNQRVTNPRRTLGKRSARPRENRQDERKGEESRPRRNAYTKKSEGRGKTPFSTARPRKSFGNKGKSGPRKPFKRR